jgi:phage host-nuclease inhibitor protein Gam
MARPPATTNAEIIAAIAQMEEQIGTLQRERREDKKEMREEVARLEHVFTTGIAGLKTDLAAQLAPIKVELAPLTKMRWQAAGIVLSIMLLAGYLGHKIGEPLSKLFPPN